MIDKFLIDQHILYLFIARIVLFQVFGVLFMVHQLFL